ncbi:cytidylyltransferase domain-containing protein [Ectothiorhodospira variabilis]|uniref:acylneuraminate cytidylyltransferase family protein n=1 Tax=Ectothiorhodospira variabilis TaxID=505694 RepID=UPI001EFB78D8|nr:acylneuraminate cytidylyltransferase family protein [Ectothiorhodospira variabilis]MCG5497795.1 acylneuraminate cytidylyltransferase family protein [Ectothiorhodospira variabilis]
MNVVIITARAGSKSIPSKNILKLDGRPLLAYVIDAAQKAARIDRVFVDTDGAEIAAVARDMGVEVIDRPEELAGDHVNHGDVIQYDVHHVRARHPDLRNVVVLLGNTVMIDGPLIDEAVSLLEARDELDSVMTVWEAGDDHPLRALEIRDGQVCPYGNLNDTTVSTERQSYPKAYYYDQGVWAFRHSCVDAKEGPRPWWWMGKNVYPIVRPWITGRDINGPFDVPFHEWWIRYPERIQRAIEDEWTSRARTESQESDI